MKLAEKLVEPYLFMKAYMQIRDMIASRVELLAYSMG
jgi:hypothetical protein